MQIYEIKIPKRRVAVLIGEKGSDKRKIEKLTKCKINVNSEGEVKISVEFEASRIIFRATEPI